MSIHSKGWSSWQPFGPLLTPSHHLSVGPFGGPLTEGVGDGRANAGYELPMRLNTASLPKGDWTNRSSVGRRARVNDGYRDISGLDVDDGGRIHGLSLEMVM